MKPLPLVLAFLISGLSLLTAKPIDLPDDKLHLDIPDAWTSSTPGGKIIFSASDAGNTAAANLVKMSNDQGEGIDDPNFVKGVQEGFTNKVKSQGMNVTISQQGPVTLNGVTFYSFQGTFGAPGGQVTNFHMYVTAANDQIYMLSLQSSQADAEDAVQGIANSLNFTTPPVIPDPNRPKGLSEKLGYYMGMFIGVLAVISIFKWLRLRAQRRAAKAASN